MKIFLTFILLAGSLWSFAQDDLIQKSSEKNKQLTFGANLSHFTNFNLNYTDGFSFVTSGVVNKGKCSISLGPIWWIDRNNYVNFFRGGMLSFQYYPDKTKRRINFYFINDFSYSFEKYHWNRNMKTINYTQYYNVEFKSFSQSLQEQIGYGINVKIYKGFYVNQSMTIGFEFYNYQSTTTVIEDPSLSSEYSTGNIFSASETKGYLKIGIGCNF